MCLHYHGKMTLKLRKLAFATGLVGISDAASALACSPPAVKATRKINRNYKRCCCHSQAWFVFHIRVPRIHGGISQPLPCTCVLCDTNIAIAALPEVRSKENHITHTDRALQASLSRSWSCTSISSFLLKFGLGCGLDAQAIQAAHANLDAIPSFVSA